DWLVIARDERSLPRLAFDELPEYRPPRWPDPEHPQQVHLDIAVTELDAGEALALRSGATLLQDAGGYRIYADPAGHPFCLYPEAPGGDEQAGGSVPGRIVRVVFDCFSPRALATFYGGMLDMDARELDSAERVVIAGDDRGR